MTSPIIFTPSGSASLVSSTVPDVWAAPSFGRHKSLAKTNSTSCYAKSQRIYKKTITGIQYDKLSSKFNCVLSKSIFSPATRSQKPREICGPIYSTVEEVVREQVDRAEEINYLKTIVQILQQTHSLSDKIACLNQEHRVLEFVQTLDPASPVGGAWAALSQQEEYLLKCVVVSGQGHVFLAPTDLSQKTLSKRLRALVDLAQHLESFYDVYGGILGYQTVILQLMEDAIRAKEEREQRGRHTFTVELDRRGHKNIEEDEEEEEEEEKHSGRVHYHIPAGVNLGADPERASLAAGQGIQAMPYMAEMYPVGGAGDRLGLVDEKTGEGLPSALLPYGGRSMFENLIRDLQAREYMYFRLFGQQLTTPVAVMTSAAKKNHPRLTALCESAAYWGRPKKSFRFIQQSLVPVVEVHTGRWVVSDSSPLSPTLKPGGHGVLWKLARDQGVLDWFRQQGRQAVLVRQISNPMAGTDSTLLALSGTGYYENKSMGFASCERKVGASEGMNVLLETHREDGTWDYGVSNVEYTDFERLGMEDQGATPGSTHSKFPANTNILYLGLEALECALSKDQGRAALPGLLVNLTKKPTKDGKKVCRLESSMQSIAESMLDSREGGGRMSPAQWDSLSTFVTYNLRSKVTSSAKKKREPGSSNLAQTPDGSFLTLQSNALELLRSAGMACPVTTTPESFLQSGPSCLVWLHPALGPLWKVTRQKIQGGKLHKGAELKLEIAEVAFEDVDIRGSLLITAENIMGHMNEVGEESVLQYSDLCGRCRLHGVKVVNKGVDWLNPSNQFWSQTVNRTESLEVHLEGNSEFEAAGVTIRGAHRIHVPDGFCLKLSPCAEVEYGFRTELIKLGGQDAEAPTPSWRWNYSLNQTDGNVSLVMEEASIVPEIEAGEEVKPNGNSGRWRWVAVPWGRLRRLGSNGGNGEERGNRRRRRFRGRDKPNPQAA